MSKVKLPEIKKCLDEKIIVKPILWSMYHLNAYQGPCRYGQGYSLTTEYDIETTKKEFERFKERIKSVAKAEKTIILEPVILHWNEDFIMRNSIWDEALKDDNKVDLYLVCGVRVSGYFTVELAKRTNKAISFLPAVKSLVRCDQVDMSAHLYAIGREEVYPCYDTDDLAKVFDILWVKKVMRNMKIFFPIKSAFLSFGCQSSYISLDDITKRFGTTFAHVNAQEVFDEIDSLTNDELEICSEMTAKLINEAKDVHMSPEFTKNDYMFYIAIKKMMAQRDCNAFTIPCFEVCATRELNKRKFTFCLAKSLFREEGIPSACAGDVGSVLTNALLMAITNCAPYMGNTMVWEREHNLCRIHHDSPTRFMKGYDKPMMPFELVNFALDGWGTTIRYDFSQDTGSPITLVNLSPDMKKIMIVSGEIEGCEDFLTPECTLAMRFYVKNANHFLNCQKYVGHHFGMVYGDWKDKIKSIAEAYNLEILEA